MPDEITIGVSENGTITINEDPVGQPNDKTLDNLYNEMMKMATAAKQSKTKLLITVQAEEAAKYERVINVLDVLARADITNVTFAVAEPE
jgi:biopolymer transport protein ExbD